MRRVKGGLHGLKLPTGIVWGIEVMIISIQEMITPMRDYARYYPHAPFLEKWGLWISASGIATIPSGHPYPPQGHPPDHHFDWKKGRTLDALLILVITKGKGWLETRESGRRLVEAGMAFFLLPGAWHRYRPDRSTGWTESWVEIRGPLAEGLIGEESFLSQKIVRSPAEIPGLEELMRRIHSLADDPASTRPELAAEAMRCLALLAKGAHESPSRESCARLSLRAERYLSEHHAEPLDMQEVARKLGLSYSGFRRSFSKLTGLSPWQYVLRLRLERARRLLSAGDEKLEEIASRLGFSSAFHLSSAFKKAYNQSPSNWRKRKIPLVEG